MDHIGIVGNEEINNQLALKRIESVLEWLVNNEIYRNRLTAKGHGSSDPMTMKWKEEN